MDPSSHHLRLQRGLSWWIRERLFEPSKRPELQINVIRADMLLPGTSLGIPWVWPSSPFPFLLLGPQQPSPSLLSALIYVLTQLWTSTLGPASQACPGYRDRGSELRGVGCVL